MAESSFLNPAAAVAAAGIHEGMQVAEFGAGSGFFTRASARAVGAGGVVWAVDLNSDLLSRLKNLAAVEGLHNVEVLRGDIQHIGGTHLPEGSFDFCIISNVLFVLECKPCMAQEAARILKRGGKVLAIDWSGSWGGLGPHPRDVIGKTDALKLFEAHGFTPAGDVPAGAYHWGCILKKK